MKASRKRWIRRDRRKAKASRWRRPGRGKMRACAGHGANVGCA